MPSTGDDAQVATRQRDEQKKREKNVFAAFAFSIGMGVVGLLVFAVSASPRAPTTSQPSWVGPSFAPGLAIFGLGVLVAGASALVGAVLGFLFGLPRMSDAAGGRSNGVAAGGDGNGGAIADDQNGAARMDHRRGAGYVNNNLLEISDWLTKIIVGAGLVQLDGLTGWVAATGATVGAAAGLVPGSLRTAFGTSVMVYFFAWGFLFVYIHTRTIISFIFVTMDHSLSDLFTEVKDELRETTDGIRKEMSTVRENVATEVANVVPQFQAMLSEKLSEKGIFDLLYRGDPGAARTAEVQAERLLADPSNARNGRLWLYLACARGQQHAAAVRAEVVDPEAIERLGVSTRAAIEKVLANDSDGSLRRIARGLVYVDDENHIEGDDDLASLRGDEEIARMLRPDS